MIEWAGQVGVCLSKVEPKPICEIQVAQTPDKRLTNVGTTWLTELSKAEKKEYVDLLVEKLKHMKEEDKL